MDDNTAAGGLGWPVVRFGPGGLGWPVPHETPAGAAQVQPASPAPPSVTVHSNEGNLDMGKKAKKRKRKADRRVHQVNSAPAANGSSKPTPAPASAPAASPTLSGPEPDVPVPAPARPEQLKSSVPRETRLPKPSDPQITVVANQKGGVGKTTTVVNIAVALARGGLNVLVVDLDPQGNASTALGVDHQQGVPGTYEVLMRGVPLADVVKDSAEADSLKVVPATIDLAGAEIELVSTVARESRLHKALKRYLTDHQVDYVLLDCPPSLGLLTLNALVAAGEILVPIQCEYYALEGVSQLMRTIELVKGELNDELRLGTVLLTMYDARTKLAAQVADEVRAHFSAETLRVVIPRSVRISEAPSYGQSVLSYDPESAGSRSYLDAAHEIAERAAATSRPAHVEAAEAADSREGHNHLEVP